MGFAPGAIVLEWVVGDAFRMFADPTTDTCMHTLMEDIPYGWPVMFQRTEGRVTSVQFINWSGSWAKIA
jgi:hypothetical protein